jgi:hypothetical protein
MSTCIGYTDIAKLLMKILNSQQFGMLEMNAMMKKYETTTREDQQQKNKTKQKVTKMNKTGVIRVASDG